VDWYGIFKPENPVAALSTSHRMMYGDNLIGNLSFDYKIVEGLTLKSMVGANLHNRSNEEYYPVNTTYLGGLMGGLGLLANRRITNLINENTISFQKNLGTKHQMDFLGGFTWQKETNFGQST